MTNKEIIMQTAAKFALKCQYDSIVKQNLYVQCANACGVEYEQDHEDWMLEGASETSPNIQWEKEVIETLEGKK
jgi:hypothetical protein